VEVQKFEQVQDARQLAPSMNAPTLKALVVGDNRKKRERKVEDLLCHRLSAIVLEVAEKKLRLCKSEYQQPRNRPERRSRCLDTDPRRQFESTMRRTICWSSLETKSGLQNS
jgi:hypothetical protein